MSKRLQFRTFLNHFSVLEDNTILTFKPYRKSSPIVNNKLCHMDFKKKTSLLIINQNNHTKLLPDIWIIITNMNLKVKKTYQLIIRNRLRRSRGNNRHRRAGFRTKNVIGQRRQTRLRMEKIDNQVSPRDLDSLDIPQNPVLSRRGVWVIVRDRVPPRWRATIGSKVCPAPSPELDLKAVSNRLPLVLPLEPTLGHGLQHLVPSHA